MFNWLLLCLLGVFVVFYIGVDKGSRILTTMWKLTVPEEVLEKLRCSLCNEYLSQPPVYSYPNQEGVGCGRCPVLTEQNPIRDVSYEAVAKYLFFPCRYKPYGCLETVLPAHIQDHEESCKYKQYFCPFIPLASCPWQGPSNELFAHYDEHHNLLALQDSTFEIDLINMYEDNYLLARGEELFVIHVKCDAKENEFWCSVRYVGHKKMAKRFLFEVELKRLNTVDKITLPKKVVDCDISMSLDKDTAVHADTADIKEALGDPCAIVCKINILPNEPDCINLGSEANGVTPCTTIASDDIDEDVLRELECPVCNEYMVPPIHQCVAGHSICGSCRAQVSECPTCRDKIQDTRNFSLEKMTRLFKYCCKYRDYGCIFVSSSEKIKNHEVECKFGPYECPFRGYNHCKWKGKLSDIMEHAQNEHEDNILEVDVVTWVCQEDWDDEQDGDCFLIRAFGELFKLIFKYEADTFYWSMQFVGPAEDSFKYMFELDIIDNSDAKQRLFIKRNCSPLSKHEDAVFVQLPLELLCPMINGGDLIYRCHVVKK